jgi:GT2 family glycosyltransferase
MLQGGNFIVRRDMMEKIGGYDTTIEFYGEDTDIGRRMAKVGRVKFTFKLPMYSSGRRLAKEGVFTMAFRYSLNHVWIIFFKKPYTKEHVDIRAAADAKKK